MLRSAATSWRRFVCLFWRHLPKVHRAGYSSVCRGWGWVNAAFRCGGSNSLGGELTEKGGLAMIYALIGILIYVAWRFEWRFALGAVAALVHDVLITISFFSLFGLEFSLPVLAALLAVIGYSLNDTIVVFDRIRENFRKMRKGGAVEVMNSSINQTLRRTILTSMTTLLVVATLLLIGGEVIKGFSTALFIGILVGTYSSIFIASPVVLGLGISREDMLPVKKEEAEADGLP